MILEGIGALVSFAVAYGLLRLVSRRMGTPAFFAWCDRHPFGAFAVLVAAFAGTSAVAHATMAILEAR